MKFESKMSYVLLALLVLSAVLFFTFTGRPGSGNFIQISDSDPVLGRNDAPVTVVIFGDYQCGYTKQFFDEIYPKLKEEYIDKGKVKLLYKQFPVHNEVWFAGEVSLCAHDQGKFWPYISILFDRMKEWSQDNTTFVRYANELGLDENTFLNCLNQHKYRDRVEEDYAYGRELSVSGTPTSFINGLMIKGATSVEEFESVLLKFSYI